MKLNPGALADLDQHHAAAMADLDKFVDSCRPHLAERGAAVATAVLATSIEQWMASGHQAWTPELVCTLAAQAVMRLAGQKAES